MSALSLLGIDAARSGAEVLAWSRDLVEPAMRRAMDRLPASTRRVVDYHFGWSDENGEPAVGRGSAGRDGLGKAIRPALVLLTAQGVGGDIAQALPAACAIELVHNFSLLHDDVMDRDPTRRHRPTSWVVFGTGPAILAGDALLTMAFDVLGSIGTPNAGSVLSVLSNALYELVDGQNADLSFEKQVDVGLSECVRMAAGKTGALLGGACGLGCLAGGGSQEQAEALSGFGQQLGLAFQFVDDLLGIWGNPGTTGKPVYSDLINRKKSAPVVAALNSGTVHGRQFAELYRGDGVLNEAELARAAALIESAGGRAWAEAQAEESLARGLSFLDDAGLPARARDELANLAGLAVYRDR